MKKSGCILIVDDNQELLFAMELILKPHFNQVLTLNNPELLINLLKKVSIDLVLLDMNFKAGINSGNEGLFWMKKILVEEDCPSVVLITAYADVELAVSAMKEGAIDFIQKSWDESKIISTLISAYNLHITKKKLANSQQQQRHLSSSIANSYNLCIGNSIAMKKIYDTISKVAKTDANILILGENGTGKEVIAREIHRMSERRDEIFINVDLSALTETLFESELFGSMKGAYTDAKESKPGRFEIATGGTLFLDEIGNLPMTQQSKLLSAIQNKEIVRLGSNKPISVDVRLICATNKPLYDMVANCQFREDLLYRINTIQIDVPALRDRIEDIPDLVAFYLAKFSEKYQKTGLSFETTAIDKLKEFDWPGNIRQLQNVIEKAIILSETQKIKPQDIVINQHHGNERKRTTSYNLEENEKNLIASAIHKFDGNISETAKQLGINRSTLYEKLKRYDL